MGWGATVGVPVILRVMAFSLYSAECTTLRVDVVVLVISVVGVADGFLMPIKEQKAFLPHPLAEKHFGGALLCGAPGLARCERLPALL
jgi:hypothetical protein